MNKKMKKRLIKIIISFLLIVISFLIKFNNVLFNNLLFVLAYIIVGYPIVLKAIKNIIKGKVFDENFLMSIATIGAFCIGEFMEAVAVMLFYEVGELFQSYAVDKSRKSISSLMDIRPDYANIYKDGEIIKGNVEDVNVNDIIIVKPGEKVPLDGVVIDGESLLSMQALTGESLPKKVRVNDEIISGCVNNDGVLKIKVSKKFSESTVSKILDLVENASSKKSKSENFISKFAKYYTPIVVIVALLLAVIPPLLIKDQLFSDWIYRALSFLVVSCPCALVISIPMSFFGGIGRASKIGVLIKGSNYLEALANSEIVVCDKTGTLSEGEFKVQKINSINYSKEELLKFVAHAENFSNHPISLSLKEAYAKRIDEKKIKETKEISGKGIMSNVEGKIVLVGNEKLMEEYKIDYLKNEEIGTIVYVSIDNTYEGSIVISDKIKEDSYKAMKALKENGVKKVIMLTGDKKDISESVANKLEIDECYSELLPQDKVAIVEKLMMQKSSTGKLLFVGDGINDAPVLAMSDIGVAMGGVGSDAAIEAADVVIMNDELTKIAASIKISRKTMKIVRENIIFAITIKVIVLMLSAIGVATMWWAVFADVGVSILAILNSLLVLKAKVE